MTRVYPWLPVVMIALVVGGAGAAPVTLSLSGPPPVDTLRKLYEPVDASVTPRVPSNELPFDLSQLVNLSDLPGPRGGPLDETVARLGFAITDARYADDVISMYKELGERDDPVYVTCESMLHVYHVQFDVILRSIEENTFCGMLARFCHGMQDASLRQYNDFQDPALKEAARRNLAYFSVALALVEGEHQSGPPHPVVREQVTAELDLIAGHDGPARSPIFGYDEDYSQYVPRGHYTKSPALEAYFRAMMWCGRITMLIKGREPGITDALVEGEEARLQTLQAALIAATLYGDGGKELLASWERIYAVTAFFVGASDSLTPREYAEQLQAVCGTAFGWSALAEESMYDKLREKVAALRSPRIYGGTGNVTLMPPFSPEQLDKALDATKGMRLMGQRFVPDSYVMQQLVFPRVGAYGGTGQPFTWGDGHRVFPRGLDVIAALGSDAAARLLRSEGDTEYRGYDAALRKAQGELSDLPSDDWHRNLYWGWLDALRSLSTRFPEGYPSYMRTPEWRAQMVRTALVSWTELRHDTILYAMQSYTPIAGAAPGDEHGQPPLPTGYVEPVPEFYGKLLALTRLTERGLDELQVLDEPSAGRLAALGETVERLLAISKRELSNEWLGRGDYAFIRDIGQTLEGMNPDPDQEAATSFLVADVHTDTNSGQCLEEALGPVVMIVVVWQDPDGKLRAALGPATLYHEFKHPIADRLTDQDWKELLESGSGAAMPKWTRSFTAFETDE